jgi:hypothetical protein
MMDWRSCEIVVSLTGSAWYHSIWLMMLQLLGGGGKACLLAFASSYAGLSGVLDHWIPDYWSFVVYIFFRPPFAQNECLFCL